MSNKILYAIYGDDEVLLNSAKQLRKNGVKVKDVFSPFPIHGLDPVIGVPRTRLAIGSFIYGATGLSCAWLMMGWMMIYDWPMDIGGKPSFSFLENLPAFIPISFEMTVFFAAHGMALSFLIIARLFPGQKPKNPDFRTTDDKFLMQINLEENKRSEAEIRTILKETGAMEINEKVLDEKPEFVLA